MAKTNSKTRNGSKTKTNSRRSTKTVALTTTTVDPVDITNPVWLTLPMVPPMRNYRVTVEATITPFTWPPGLNAVSRKAKLQRLVGGNWLDISPDYDLVAVSGNDWAVNITVPESVAPPGSTLQAVATVMWQTTFADPGDSPNHTVIPY